MPGAQLGTMDTEHLTPRELESRLASLAERDANQLRLVILRRYLLGEDLRGAERMLASLNARGLDAIPHWHLGLLTSEWMAISGQFSEALQGIARARDALPSPELAPELQLSHAHSLIVMGEAQDAMRLLLAIGTDARTQAFRDLLWKALTSAPPVSIETPVDISAEHVASLERVRPVVQSLLSAPTLAAQQRLLQDLDPSALGPLFDGQLPSTLKLIKGWRAGPLRVALLLPLSGPLSPVGDAFLEGFVAAWYAAGADSQVSFLLYDTNELHSDSDYSRFTSKLIGDRVELVVGPVSRAKLASVQRALPAEVGWIALNQLEEHQHLAGGQFVMELSTEEELRDLAWQIRSQGAERVLVFHQSSGWSDRALSTLEEELGEDKFIGKVRLSRPATVTEEVGLSLLIDRSEARIRAIERLLLGDVETHARRREDVDAVVSLVDGDLSTALQPALRYHGAGKVPLYGTSRMLRGLRATDYVNFEGARFFELPWNLADSVLRNRIDTQFGTASPASENFRAIGLDCFRLADRFNLVRETQQAALIDSLQGVAGLLRVSGNRIHRDLVWSQVRSGGIHALSAK